MSNRDLDYSRREGVVLDHDVRTPPRAIDHPSDIEIWAERTVEQALHARRVSWIATGALIIICAAQAAAIAIMLPLKEIVPYVVTVDRQTGYVETTRSLAPGALAQDEAVVHSLLAQYVVARETFDAADYRARYRLVSLWSGETARSDYVASYQPGTPGGVLATMRPDTRVAVTVKNVAVEADGIARIQYETLRNDPGMAAQREDRLASVAFRFTGAPMRMEDRLANPLGFQVTRFRSDALHARAEAPVATVPAEPIPTPARGVLKPIARESAARAAAPLPAPENEPVKPEMSPAPSTPPAQNPPP